MMFFGPPFVTTVCAMPCEKNYPYHKQKSEVSNKDIDYPYFLGRTVLSYMHMHVEKYIGNTNHLRSFRYVGISRDLDYM